MRIGEVLKRARTRQGLEIREVEERTKIRIKYLRALEGEDWEVLPGPAYTKGFLRTYARMLGLDADAVIDEYARQVEGERAGVEQVAFGEPVLERRRRPGERQPEGPGPGRLVALGAAAAVLVLALIGLLGGGEEEPAPERSAGKRQAERAAERKRERAVERAKERRRERRKAAAANEVTLALDVSSALPVCLLGPGEKVLIAGQVLNAGTEERFSESRFVLRFPSGYDLSQFALRLDGKPAKLEEVSGPAAYEIKAGRRPRLLDPPPPSCP